MHNNISVQTYTNNYFASEELENAEINKNPGDFAINRRLGKTYQ